MGKQKLRGRELNKLGFPQGPITSMVIQVFGKKYKYDSKEVKLSVAKQLIAEPEIFLDNPIWTAIAELLVDAPVQEPNELALSKEAKTLQIYGEEHIEPAAINQMHTAMKLPITLKGALMPDAHYGYGLPIGGVLATQNAVIPYGVGVDIGCRMALTIYDIPPSFIENQRFKLKNWLSEHTKFGDRETFLNPMDHEVLDRQEFNEIPIAKKLKDKAWKQIGTSGSGNHFVEFGVVHVVDEHNEFGIPVGDYLGVLSHSGSRGLGATIARYYTDLAMEITRLPKMAKHLAWLKLDTEEGQEYWQAMNLAGDYAKACHDQIHHRLSRELNRRPLVKIENHHNFAWKETLADGTEAIVHRKGATPAGKGVYGIIPGSMTAPGYIVRGRGLDDAINSASHGAGRLLSRRAAKESLTPSELKKHLDDHKVLLLGGGLDEAPMAYKDIGAVMSAQSELVDIVGSFTPKIVRMDGR